jgi:dienelactone hydrolase
MDYTQLDYVHSPWDYFRALADRTQPKLRFSGETRDDFVAWREAFDAKLRELIGPMPQAGDLNAEIIDERPHGNLTLQTVLFESEPGVKVKALILLPEGYDGTPLPAVICAHGHSYNAKYNMVDIDHGDAELRQFIDDAHYAYGKQFAEHGHLTIAIDSRGWGERGDGPAPFGSSRDRCNVYHIIAESLGYNWIAFQIFDYLRTVDYLYARPDVQRCCIGVCGLSFGGTMALYLAALDDRIAAAIVSCYLTTYRAYAVDLANFCGSQHVPGLMQWGDVSEVAGLIAPRPVLFQSGRDDTGFPVAAAVEAFAEVQRIYRAAGADGRAVHDVFDGPHTYNPATGPPFMDQWLRR